MKERKRKTGLIVGFKIYGANPLIVAKYRKNPFATIANQVAEICFTAISKKVIEIFVIIK